MECEESSKVVFRNVETISVFHVIAAPQIPVVSAGSLGFFLWDSSLLHPDSARMDTKQFALLGSFGRQAVLPRAGEHNRANKARTFSRSQ